MKRAVPAVIFFLLSALTYAQDTFEVTGTSIPSDLIKKNFGSVPKGIGAYDLMICNSTEKKQSLVSSRLYQAISLSDPTLAPVGRQIMLAAILRNQNLSPVSLTNVVVGAISGVLTILGSSSYKLPNGLATATALATVSGQQILSSFRPLLAADQLEKFESQVLDPAIILDGRSCVEKTIFTKGDTSKKAKRQNGSISFHVQ